VDSAFFGLNTGIRGLYSAQKSLHVVNHNINNVNTPGFSRQKAEQTASAPFPVGDGTGMMGTGADIVSIDRIRDEFLDYKYWSENINNGEWEIKKGLLSEIEAIFNEPSDSGFVKVIEEFYNALHELSKDPGSLAVRSVVKQTGVSFTRYFNNIAAGFEKSQANINQNIKIKIDEVNSIADGIKELNRQIYNLELDGSSANDLRDQRTVLVDKLSGIINIDAYEVNAGKLPDGRPDMHFVLNISGKALVDHFKSYKLKVTQRDALDRLNAEDIQNLYEVGWEDGNSLKIKGGELKGYIDIRDGNNGMMGLDGITKSPDFKGIPFYIRKMNEFVRLYARAFNEGYIDNDSNGIIDPSEDLEGHADGYGLDPDGFGGQPSPTGIRFFTMKNSDGKPMSSMSFINGMTTISDICDIYDNITAKNFCVSDDIIRDEGKIAASDTDGQTGNTKMVQNLIDMRNNKKMVSQGMPEDFMKSIVATVGIDSQQAVKFSKSQRHIMEYIENQRFSKSGVSLDEEMANMVKYQHAYEAAAKMISTMQDVYDILINKIGQ
jgi:flagellar hook-associated protein 1